MFPRLPQTRLMFFVFLRRKNSHKLFPPPVFRKCRPPSTKSTGPGLAPPSKPGKVAANSPPPSRKSSPPPPPTKGKKSFAKSSPAFASSTTATLSISRPPSSPPPPSRHSHAAAGSAEISPALLCALVVADLQVGSFALSLRPLYL